MESVQIQNQNIQPDDEDSKYYFDISSLLKYNQYDVKLEKYYEPKMFRTPLQSGGDIQFLLKQLQTNNITINPEFEKIKALISQPEAQNQQTEIEADKKAVQADRNNQNAQVQKLPLIKKEKQKYEGLKKELEEKNQIYNDESFKPNQDSLGPGIQICEWMRIADLSNLPQLFQDSVSPTDIRQGDLGDCYFLSSLAALSEWPQLIKNLFLTEKFNKYGLVTVTMCWKGVFQEINLDDWFPIENNIPIFSRCINDEFWVQYMEKAWAKLHGSFAKIDGALSREPLHDLTGAPTKTYNILVGKSGDDPWNHHVYERIKDGERRNHAMCAGTILYQDGTSEQQHMEKNLGLITGHIYTLMSCFKLDFGKGYKEKVLQLRNPWGDHEWRGRLSDKDPIWKKISQETKDKIGYNDSENDGIFFMPYEDFLSSFDDVTICFQYPTENYKYEGVPFDITSSNVKVFTMKIEQPGSYFVQVCQRSIRTAAIEFSGNDKNQTIFYSDIQLAVKKQGVDQFNYKVTGNRREVTNWKYVEKPTEMEAGVYEVYVKISPSQYQKDDPVYGLGVYGSSLVMLVEQSAETKDKFVQQFQNQLKNEDFQKIY